MFDCLLAALIIQSHFSPTAVQPGSYCGIKKNTESNFNVLFTGKCTLLRMFGPAERPSLVQMLETCWACGAWMDVERSDLWKIFTSARRVTTPCGATQESRQLKGKWVAAGRPLTDKTTNTKNKNGKHPVMMVPFQWRWWNRAHVHIHIVGCCFWQAGGPTLMVKPFMSALFGRTGRPSPAATAQRLSHGGLPDAGRFRLVFFHSGNRIDGPSTKEPAGNLESTAGRLSTR